MSLRTDGLIEELKGAIKDSDATYNEIICDAREEAATHKKVRQQLLEDLRKVERDRDIYKESYRNAHKAFGDLQDVVLGKGSTTETYDDLLAPVRELVNLKETIRFYLGMNYDSSCVKLVYELRRVLNSGFTEERDSILSEIRKVLGAKDRSDNNPHETALQAAKRVMVELTDYRAERNIAKKLRELTGAETTTAALKIVKDWGDLKPTVHNKACIAGANTSDLKDFVSNQFLPGNKVVLSGDSYRQLMRDSEDLKVIKQKLGLTD